MGQELHSDDPLDMKNKETAFPAKLGAINDAWSASNTQSIFNRTIDYCNNNPVDVVIIGWTHYARILQTPDDHPRLDRMQQHTIKGGEVWLKHFMGKALARSQEILIESLHEILTARNIRPIFFKSFDSDIDPQCPMLWNGSNWDHEYYRWLRRPKTDRKMGAHPKQHQHDWLALYLKKVLENE